MKLKLTKGIILFIVFTISSISCQNQTQKQVDNFKKKLTEEDFFW
jgi:hypothetical protein